MQTRAGQRDEVGGEFFSYKYDSVVVKWKNKHESTVELFVNPSEHSSEIEDGKAAVSATMTKTQVSRLLQRKR